MSGNLSSATTSCESCACLLLWAPTSSPLHGELVLKVSSDLEVPGVKFPGPACGREATEGPSESQLWSLSQKAPSQVDLNFLLSYWGGAPSSLHSHLLPLYPCFSPKHHFFSKEQLNTSRREGEKHWELVHLFSGQTVGPWASHSPLPNLLDCSFFLYTTGTGVITRSF